MRTIALINQKGGVGKTTTTVNIGAGLAALGKNVLLIDLDPQANLTISMGLKIEEQKNTVYDLLKGTANLKETIVHQGNIDIIPSTLDLAGAEIGLSGVPGREVLLKEQVSKASGYDYILIDCPPSLGLLTLNALTTCKEVFIPLAAEYLALQGMSQLLKTIDLVKNRLNTELETTGIIITRYDQRKNLSKEVVASIQEKFERILFKTLIRENVSLAEAPSHGQTIFDYSKTSNGAEDYKNLCNEITAKSFKAMPVMAQ